MEQYIIKGGNPLVGEVEIGGAKNAALGILAAAIMADEPVLIENLPDVNDINVMLEAIELAVGLMIMDADSSSARNLLEFPFITSPFLRISFAHLLRIPSDFFRQLGGACPRQ